MFQILLPRTRATRTGLISLDTLENDYLKMFTLSENLCMTTWHTMCFRENNNAGCQRSYTVADILWMRVLAFAVSYRICENFVVIWAAGICFNLWRVGIHLKLLFKGKRKIIFLEVYRFALAVNNYFELKSSTWQTEIIIISTTRIYLFTKIIEFFGHVVFWHHLANWNHCISTTTVPPVIRHGRLLTYFQWFLTIKSHDPLIMWSFGVSWQIKCVLASFALDQWPSNMESWSVTVRDVHPYSHITP